LRKHAIRQGNILDGFQFIHIESYSLQNTKKKKERWSVRQILDEADRKPGSCHHVQHPQIPRQHGPLKLADLEHEIRKRIAESKDVKGRQIRADALVLLAGVASTPLTSLEIKSEPKKNAEFKNWVSQNVNFLRTEFGENLVNVTIHLDERFGHLHFYCIPQQSQSGYNLNALHPGQRWENREKQKTGKSSKAAYQSGMRAFQDRYFSAVAVPCGLTRLGPKKRRLTRKGWHNEKMAAHATVIARKQADEILQQATDQANEIVERSKPTNLLSKIAGRQTKAEQNANVAKEEALRKVSAAEAHASKLRLRVSDLADQLSFSKEMSKEYFTRSNLLEEQNRKLQREVEELRSNEIYTPPEPEEPKL
jgi:hypothetical protein